MHSAISRRNRHQLGGSIAVGVGQRGDLYVLHIQPTIRKNHAQVIESSRNFDWEPLSRDPILPTAGVGEGDFAGIVGVDTNPGLLTGRFGSRGEPDGVSTGTRDSKQIVVRCAGPEPT